MNIYERCGRLMEAQANAIEAHQRTLKLLTEIKSGAMPLDRVTVTGNGWEIQPEPGGDDDGEEGPTVAGKVGAGKAG